MPREKKPATLIVNQLAAVTAGLTNGRGPNPGRRTDHCGVASLDGVRALLRLPVALRISTEEGLGPEEGDVPREEVRPHLRSRAGCCYPPVRISRTVLPSNLRNVLGGIHLHASQDESRSLLVPGSRQLLGDLLRRNVRDSRLRHLVHRQDVPAGRGSDALHGLGRRRNWCGEEPEVQEKDQGLGRLPGDATRVYPPGRAGGTCRRTRRSGCYTSGMHRVDRRQPQHSSREPGYVDTGIHFQG